MMKLLVIFSFICSTQSMSAEWTHFWNDSYQKVVKAECSENDDLCLRACGEEKSCEFEEGICRDCIGTSLYMTSLFNGMGKIYRSTDTVRSSELLDLIETGDFITLSSKSIYNHVEAFNSKKLKARFQSLCSDGTKYPLVFIAAESGSRLPGEVLYVTCGNHVLKMEQDPEILKDSIDLM